VNLEPRDLIRDDIARQRSISMGDTVQTINSQITKQQLNELQVDYLGEYSQKYPKTV